MTFRTADFNHLVKFNSAVSSDFIAAYENYVDKKIVSESLSVSHRSFAPSSFRCSRIQWFRLRGVTPDKIKIPDKVLNFSANMGTAIHRIIQSNLRDMLQESWVDVMSYVNENFKDYSAQYSDDSSEVLITCSYPPVRFACDGIINISGKYYLLEIKSSDYSSWKDLTDPKDHHIDQVNCYSTLLGIRDVLFFYVDRQYGGIKCYEYHVPEYVTHDVRTKMKEIMECVESNLAPDPLPKGDNWCTENMCPYYWKCSEYGR